MKDLLVVGGATLQWKKLYFDSFAKTVTIIHRRDELPCTKVLQDHVHLPMKKSTLFRVQL